MPRANPLKDSGNAGELSPRLVARTSFGKYPNGQETLENLIPLAEGGLMRRPATRYVAEIKSSAVKGRVKRFQFSTTQAYVLEFGESAIRFYRHQGQITVADTDAAITNGTFPSGITSWTDQSGAGSSIAHDATNARLTITSNGTTNGHAEQQVTNTTAVEHVLKFQTFGAPGDKIKLRIGTSSTGTQLVNDVEFAVGYHAYAFTATAADFFVQFLHSTAKGLQVDNVSLIDNAPMELQTPYAEAILFEIEGPQSADVLYLFNETKPTYSLERSGHTSWSLVETAWQDGPWLKLNDTTTTLTFGAATGLGVTVTASAIVGINDGAGFKTTDIGRLIRLTDNTTKNWGWAVITGWTSTTVVTVDVNRSVVVTTAETEWKLGEWSGTTGYPSAGAFFEQRLAAAGSSDKPQTFWMSQTGDFENHSPDSANSSGVWDATVEDDDALDYTISSDGVNAIRWLSPGQDTLSIGTRAGEWTPSSTGAVLTPTDIAVRQQTAHGSKRVQPVRVDKVVLFVQRAGRKLREFGFTFESDGFEAFDMTRLAQHVTRGGIVEMDFAEEPDSIVWAVRADGQLLSMTFRREEDVVGWARHIIGGSFYGSITKVWQVDDATFVEETTDANSAGNADWTLFPASEAVGDYAAFGHTAPFNKLVFDYANGTAGVGGVVTWEYWDGSAWTTLPSVTDNTTSLTVAAADNLSVTWTEPLDWKRRVLSSGKSLFYVRARITTTYTTNPILDQGFIPGDAVVESVVVIPGANGAGQTQDSSDRDEVWLIVKRTINGATKRYVEFLERDFEDGDDQEDAYYADSIITYDSTATTSITGLDHLEGETIKVWADGAIVADKVVASGAITLATAASVVQAGLGYTHRLKTLKMEGGSAIGTAVGKIKRLVKLTLVLLNSHTVKQGPSTANLNEIDFRVVSDAMDAGAPLFTGEAAVDFEGDWETDSRVVLESDAPAPFTLLAMAPEFVVNDPK